MNKMNERNHHIIMEPLTPNLEQYKTQNRNKTKKKNGCPNIQPTLPPVQSPALVIATPSNNNI
jgi:hypothetical protein